MMVPIVSIYMSRYGLSHYVVDIMSGSQIAQSVESRSDCTFSLTIQRIVEISHSLERRRNNLVNVLRADSNFKTTADIRLNF